MKNFRLLIFILLTYIAYSFTAKELTKSLAINKNSSMVEFKIEDKLGTTRVGYFDPPQGTIIFDRSDLAKSHFQVTLSVKSINTNNRLRDNDLLSSHFFEANKYPEMSFVSKNLISTQKGFEVTGDLKIKDVTKTIKIPFIFVEDQNGNYFGSEFSLNRLDFNVGANNETIGKDIKVILKIVVL